MGSYRIMRLYVIRVDITEAATNHRYPIVRHEFSGRTHEEAIGYLRSHMRSDRFLRDCIESEKFDRVQCRATVNSFWRTVR